MKELLTSLDHQTISENGGFHRINPDYRIIDDISKSLGGSVFGQEEACNQLARAVTRSMAGFSDPRRPESIMMFLGSTGVGKTETAKSLAKYLNGDKWEDKFLRIDCTEFQEPHAIARLKGTEPGYIGYGDKNIIITPEFLAQGGSKVIVLDEIEKAHGNFDRFFMPIFSEGKTKVMAPVQGNKGWSSELVELNFADTFFVLTSNVGAQELQKAKMGKSMGFGRDKTTGDMNKIAMNELKKYWAPMPEFLGRIDAFITFKDLSRDSHEKIFNKFIDEINQDQRYGRNYLAVTKELRDYVLDHSETDEYGAREIKHKINQYIVDKASEIKFSGSLPENAPLIGDIEDNGVIFWTSAIEEQNPDLRLVTTKKKDTGSYIGNRPDTRNEDIYVEEVGPEETDMEDISPEEEDDEKPRASVAFYVPFRAGATIDLSITVKQPGQPDLNQIITQLPLLEESK